MKRFAARSHARLGPILSLLAFLALALLVPTGCLSESATSGSWLQPGPLALLGGQGSATGRVSVRVDGLAPPPPDGRGTQGLLYKEIRVTVAGTTRTLGAADPAVVTFTGVPAGTADIEVTVFDDYGRVVGAAATTAEILAGSETVIRVRVELRRSRPPGAEVILAIRLTPGSLVLNAMPASGSPEESLPAEARIRAEVITAIGPDPTLEVTWFTSRPDLVTVHDGLVRVRRDRGVGHEGTSEVGASSVDDPLVSATISVRVTRDGALDLGVR